MTSYVAKTALKKLLGKKLQDKFGQGDPYIERVPGVKRNGQPSGKQVKQKRALPPGLSEHDAKVLVRVRRRVHHLDWSLFTIFGVGFGWSTVIGIIPGIGDAIDGLMSLTVFRKCCKIEGGLPVGVKLHMLLNVALDFVIGLVPGAEALYRGNTRNALLLEDFLRDRAEEIVRQTGSASNVVDIKKGRRNGRGKRSDRLDSYRDERGYQDVVTVSGESSERQIATKKRPRRPW